MNHRFRWSASGATLFQLAAEVSCVVLAVSLTLRVADLRPAYLRDLQLAPAFLFALLMVALNYMFGLYRRDARRSLRDFVGRQFLAIAIGAPIAWLVAAHLPGGLVFRDSLEQWALVAFLSLVLVRLAIVAPLQARAAPHRVLVLGTGADARAVELSLASLPRGTQLIGFYPLGQALDIAVSPRAIVRRDRTLEQTVREYAVNEIVVAVREQRGGVLPVQALLDCRLLGIRVTDLPRFFETVQHRIPVEALKASWLIYGSGFRQGLARTIVKRLFDIAAATTLLVFALPVMAVTALLIAAEGGGPVIYRQQRVGLRGKCFDVLKFRSMRQDAEKDGRPQWAIVGDPRVTPLGRFLRRSRIDELPQLVNVLRGEMSFVGPRPERPAFVEMLSAEVPFYAARLSIKPGLTGWAQVRYSYGATVEQSIRKLEYDLYYVKNHSLLLDLRILFATVRVVLYGQGAR